VTARHLTGSWIAAGLLLAAAPAVEVAGGEASLHRAPVAPDTTTVALDAAIAGLRADLDDVLSGAAWRRATWGVLAVSLDTGDTLWARNADRSMIPASNVKLFTTAAALHYLGRDYRFRTFVLATGPVVDGVLEGDLVLYGTGDPGISDRFYPSRGAVMDSLAAALRDAGLHRVRGRVLGDGTFFSGPDRLAEWDPDDLNEWFAAASGALSYNENVVTLRIAASTAGSPPNVHTLPDHGGVAYVNEAQTVAGRPGSRLVLDRPDPSEPIRIFGEIAASGPDAWRRMTVQQPALFAAHALHRALEAYGIEVAASPDLVRDASASPLAGASTQRAGGSSTPRVLAEHRSRPLADYLAVINQQSHNLFADLVLRALGRAIEGEGSYAAGARVVARYLENEVGLPSGAVHLVDGSGLAAANRASPGAFVALIDHLASGPYWEDFRGTLPEAGSRSLNRMRRTAAAGNLRAKTGTIRGVSALSGIVQATDGERIAFSLIGNDLPSAWGAKRLEDRIGARLAELSRSGPEGAPAERRAESAPQFDP
jgi:serine-type D-Ala-D-Ala carboxypeptidase/endopeptidase (penicillin-binding protein 4)